MSEKKPRLFLHWPNSGDGAGLIVADVADLELLRAGGGLIDDLRELLTGDYEDGEEIAIVRKAMTNKEVEALPDL